MLLTADILIKLLEFHDLFLFSQDELRMLFETKGEVTNETIDELTLPYLKHLRTCALVFLSLLEEPTSNLDKRKRNWLSIQNLLGLVASLSWFLKVKNVTTSDVINAINGLSSPLRRIIHLTHDERVRLASVPFEVVMEKMGRQGAIFREILLDFQSKIKLKQSTE